MKDFGPGGVGGWAWWAFGSGSLTRMGVRENCGERGLVCVVGGEGKGKKQKEQGEPKTLSVILSYFLFLSFFPILPLGSYSCSYSYSS